MRSDALVNNGSGLGRFTHLAITLPRHFVIGMILIIALMAFEMFNFDTTRFALESLLGEVRFVGFAWATILAIAFCAIDFAGLARLFTPERGGEQPKEIWYLTGAWLLGATMNALMTWWAVSLTLLNHNLGNEVLSREELLKIVPVFVAILVWLTRILFIGAVTAAGERILRQRPTARQSNGVRQAASKSARPNRNVKSANRPVTSGPVRNGTTQGTRPTNIVNSRVRQRSLRPSAGQANRLGYNGLRASGTHSR